MLRPRQHFRLSVMIFAYCQRTLDPVRMIATVSNQLHHWVFFSCCNNSSLTLQNSKDQAGHKPNGKYKHSQSPQQPDSDNLTKLQQQPGGKKFNFRKDVQSVRMLPWQSQELPWVENQYVTIFVEDENDENICSRQIVQCMALSSPVNLILFDV
ncbi:hypothetical protein DPEC_G00324270 [Dallia pectoralis]|uniref:Uncharacterized protein n=1 Tax=Dallia pectoralis TaxID=75939 RepID=A0ACC2FAS9_DALPE|nr:hypothetical protein DPEC_G00324270 [Dallia pectoralis]